MSQTSEPTGQHAVGQFVDDFLRRGLGARSTDIHFEPTDSDMLVRTRIDGHLLDFGSIPAELAPNVVARLKVLAGLLTYRIDIPQEGSVAWRAMGADTDDPVDLRVATFPTIRGERAVVRVFQAADDHADLPALGFDEVCSRRLHEAVRAPTGLVVVCGPAGSGKSTTLYALLGYLRDQQPHRSLITLEDPVERRIDRVTQIQINPHGELDYERCMRSLLRQDPQVLLVGEVRDARTAAVVIEAALTGHLVLTTVHSGDPAQAIVRLLEMGIPPYQLASTLTVACAQRLIRKRCTACGAHTDPSCPRCLGTGYAGRTALAQVVRVDDALHEAILAEKTAAAMRSLLAEQGDTLALRGEALVKQGLTDEVECLRVLGNKVDEPAMRSS